MAAAGYPTYISTRLEEVVGCASNMIDALRTSDAPDDILERVQASLQDALLLLGKHQFEGPYTQSLRNVEAEDFFSKPSPDPQKLMPYSPIIGRLNPVSPRIEFHAVGDRLEGHGHFPVRFVGAPQTAHGGLVAAALDEMMGMVNFLNGAGSYTGTMTVRYHRPTPILRPLQFGAEMLRVEGRKVHSRAEIRCDGELTASSEGLFVRPR